MQFCCNSSLSCTMSALKFPCSRDFRTRTRTTYLRKVPKYKILNADLSLFRIKLNPVKVNGNPIEFCQSMLRALLAVRPVHTRIVLILCDPRSAANFDLVQVTDTFTGQQKPFCVQTGYGVAPSLFSVGRSANLPVAEICASSAFSLFFILHSSRAVNRTHITLTGQWPPEAMDLSVPTRLANIRLKLLQKSLETSHTCLPTSDAQT